MKPQMRIQLLSDIHIECHQDNGASFIDELRSIDHGSVDVLVLAGDIHHSAQLEPFIAQLLSLYRNIIFVPGNHEYYYSTVEKSTKNFNRLSIHPNLHVLNPGSVTIGGQRFIGATMWYPGTPMVDSQKHTWPDFLCTKDLKRNITQMARRDQMFLDENMLPTDVVITHMVPLASVNDPRYMNDPCNDFFVIDQSKLISEHSPKLWLHGHTHYANRTVLPNGTIIVNNAFGYPTSPVAGFSLECYEAISVG